MVVEGGKLPEYTVSFIPCPNITLHDPVAELVTPSENVTQKPPDSQQMCDSKCSKTI